MTGLDKRFPEVIQGALTKVAEINLLEASAQLPFVKNLYHNTVPDPGVAKMTADYGADCDCKGLYPTYPFPTKAKGVIVQVVIYATDINKKNLAFLCGDSKGAFGENRLTNFTNVANGGGKGDYTNPYRPIGGMLFCPFIEHSTTFKYRLDSEGIPADRDIACQGIIIGWF